MICVVKTLGSTWITEMTLSKYIDLKSHRICRHTSKEGGLKEYNLYDGRKPYYYIPCYYCGISYKFYPLTREVTHLKFGTYEFI